MALEIRTKDNLWRKILEILNGPFVTGWNIFRNLIKRGCEIRVSGVKNFLKINKQGGDVY